MFNPVAIGVDAMAKWLARTPMALQLNVTLTAGRAG